MKMTSPLMARQSLPLGRHPRELVLLGVLRDWPGGDAAIELDVTAMRLRHRAEDDPPCLTSPASTSSASSTCAPDRVQFSFSCWPQLQGPFGRLPFCGCHFGM
jgi:hypothetical protein